jgi:hypothetical protein
MHDPMTVAHEIKYPWYRNKPWPKKARKNPDPWHLKRHWDEMTEVQKVKLSRHWPEGYRDTFITIWHVDPERDGSDDSCGYSYIKLTPHQRERLRNAAWSEGHNPHFLCCPAKEWEGTFTEAEALYRGMVLMVCRVLKIKITFDEACKYASEACHIRDIGKTGDTFCFLPGYHTNSQTDSKEDRQEHFCGILCGVARNILTDRRHWWQHPKWHFWHWKIQCQPINDFKRWAFSRCSKCGKCFRWGYAPCTNGWNGSGPRWFRNEKDVFHSDCNRPESECVAESEC